MSPRYAHITGWGMAVPEKIVTNKDLEKMVDTNDEWIVSRTGIRERHIASDGQSTATLAAEPGCALEVANLRPADLIDHRIHLHTGAHFPGYGLPCPGQDRRH
jgi:3-oxoacyl-[acyl-carrier-protein] synthase-3